MQLRFILPCILILAYQYFFVKDALTYATPVAFQALVYSFMTLSLLAVTRFRLILNKGTLLFSLFFWLSGACWIFGLSYLSPAVAAVLSFTMPLFSVPLSVVLLSERNSRIEVTGTTVGFAGVALFNLPLLSGYTTLLGITLTLGNGFFWALFSVYSKRLKSQDPVQTIATASLISVLAYGAFLLMGFRMNLSFSLAVDVAYMALVAGALNVLLWIYLLKVEKVSKITTLAFAAPVITLAYGTLTSGVLPSYFEIGGVALIFVGIYLANILAPKEKFH